MSNNPRWMLYGATGYTGKILVPGAVERGHKPIIAGRNAEKLRPLAEQYDLESVTFGLDDAASVEKAIRDAGVELVLHAAGPFTMTAEPMRQACISAGVHYLDITGEVGVFEATFAADDAAKDAGVLLMSGVGFDIVPSDCLVKYVADKLPDADSLDVVISALSVTASEIGLTAGTIKSLLEMLPNGSIIRRNGELQPADFGSISGRFLLPGGTFHALAIPWGDVSTAYRTTGIPNITAYITQPSMMVTAAKYTGVVLQRLARSDRFRKVAGRQIDRFIKGPSENTRETARSYVYARASKRSGAVSEAWLETKEGYAFTVDSALNSVERVLDGDYRGALTPALAFGEDFVLDVPTTRRYDTLGDAAGTS